MDKNSNFATRLRTLLETKGLTQSELARLSGVTKSALSHYLKGDFEGKQDVVYRIAHTTSVQEPWLMGYDVPMEKPPTGASSECSHTNQQTNGLDALYRQLGQLAARYGANKLVLYGSRARGDYRPGSDIDLAVYGMPEKNQAAFWLDTEDLPTLLKLDIVHIRPGMDARFLSNIEKDGVLLMGKFEEKYIKLQTAVDRLKEALDEYEKMPTSTVRDGIIQRFEFCTELSWKTLREYLLDQGYTEINSPKATIRQGFVEGAIKDEAWLNLLDDRNITSHVYDDETAGMVFQRIRTQYLALFTALVDYLKG